MISLTAAEIASITGGTLHQLDADEIISQNPVIDSRQATDQTFFVAFKGENVDGNDFAATAIGNGARFALVERACDGPCIIVPDAGIALMRLGKAVRERLTNLSVIAITGSQGKTTTKDLLRHILEIVGPTVATQASFNNDIGLPLTLLRCTEATKFCIVEMGARHLGDIARLVEIAKPNIGCVLVVGQAHLGEFGSRENIAAAKSEMISHLGPHSVAVLGNYDEFTPLMARGLALRSVLFGENSTCAVRAADIELREGRAHFDLVTPAGRAAVGLQLLGLHQIANALAAAAIATELSVPIDVIASALSTAEPSSKWRMELHDQQGILLINDAYNANPDSMAAAVRTLALLSQERGGLSWAFLGKMAELGASEAQEHAEIGRLIYEVGIDHLVCVGTKAFAPPEEVQNFMSREYGDETTVHYCDSIAEAAALTSHITSGDVVLVKASRSVHLDLLADELLAALQVKSE